MTGTVATHRGQASVRRGIGFWSTRLVDVLVAATGVLPLADPRQYRDPAVLLGYGSLWLGLGLVYIAIRLVRLRRSRRDLPGWEQRLAGRRTGYLVTAATTLQVLGSGLVLSVGSSAGAVLDPAYEQAVVALSVVIVVVAWSMLHLGYAERYARIWLREAVTTGGEPIAFPGTPSPRLRDFTYFSFTIGLSFATSDCVVRSPALRAVVLPHSVLSNAYNTAILGIVVGLIAG